MQKIKLIILLVLAALTIVLGVQDIQAVDDGWSLATMTMPRAALLMVALLMGFTFVILAAISIRQQLRKFP